MATKTEEAINDLEVEVNVLKAHVKALQEQTNSFPEITSRLAIVEHKLTEMTKTKELWGQRGWMIMTICLSAGFSFLSTLLGAAISYYLNTKK